MLPPTCGTTNMIPSSAYPPTSCRTAAFYDRTNATNSDYPPMHLHLHRLHDHTELCGFRSLYHRRIVESEGYSTGASQVYIGRFCLRGIGSEVRPCTFPKGTPSTRSRIRIRTHQCNFCNLCNVSDNLPHESQVTLRSLITPNLWPSKCFKL